MLKTNNNQSKDLRGALEWLKSEGLLLETDVEVNPDLEITALEKHLDGSLPMLFNNVKNYPHLRAVTNLFGNTSVMNKMFGWENDTERTKDISYALTHPLPPIEIDQDEAPVQEFVITDDLDVNKWLLAIKHTPLEDEFTIGSGQSVVVGKYFKEGSHVGYNRMSFRWGNVGTFQAAPGSHMWQLQVEHYNKPEGIPITMCFGIPPAANLMAGSGFDYVILPKGCDELGIAGALQGEPLRIVKCRTVDAYALADAEVVLEGYLKPKDRRWETTEAEKQGLQGKAWFHPEWAGYQGKAYKTSTFHVTAITMRKPESKPIIFPLGVHTMDDSNIDTTVREAAIYELCERLQPGIVQDVSIPYCFTDWGGCVIQVKKRSIIEEGWQRNFLTAIMSCNQGMRIAIAIDTDVDINSMEDIMWAVTTRVNPKTDIISPVPGGIGQTFMPAERMTAGEKDWTASNTRFEGGMAIDATIPFGYEEDFHRPTYAVDKVLIKNFFSDEQIKKGESFMSGWVKILSKTGQ
ncbi:UbiD family decarboxylase [Desulfobacula toluolica]|uniref:UbiD2: 3-octaprenyl-4-hydroxybenzoate carboxy-lyase n=1 Tax=Desulfobacula toluolica (strain DSM 7467 / Tol2) TaxID=651182 RepID=K0NPW0_DESTT|nr:UbiD family decarboxylase [Desulfobacula toluolica]CCK80850.1 UbiD: 3-octaprenyl-4-hydroxybenzoate carboxy-lyase [Desulfobacula toluolica Tol2]CCK80869.1 UbiD2: 3-octaprenyl-4-hydroxybenzoate carboxy-lyase [Desulfobacula toluolica Tol2]CCK80886.1 UbiD3: 3-octaprenyl-4-hydroxybenzoate carboxy-lyase [Desulfobacula toluolica Tol2]CCK80907.1 UbiD4: 3-octaprenyl-4-hydroxybenzoate carboxy-lyase [Desulfobacula toluolica Tol2]CCK80926.1 UbiD5: 3-octaprenyl-4-hydroxybenzoate carboxy-lyase [Desulfoba